MENQNHGAPKMDISMHLRVLQRVKQRLDQQLGEALGDLKVEEIIKKEVEDAHKAPQPNVQKDDGAHHQNE